MDSAITCYKQAADNLSLCRVYCYNDNLKAAIELCNETNDATANYHLARQFERNKNFKEAINYYQRAYVFSLWSMCYMFSIWIMKTNLIPNR